MLFYHACSVWDHYYTDFPLTGAEKHILAPSCIILFQSDKLIYYRISGYVGVDSPPHKVQMKSEQNIGNGIFNFWTRQPLLT